MCCCGVIVVAQPGGTLLFHKELVANFGLSPPAGDGAAQQQPQRWEPWSLGALLSSLQVYAQGVATANSKTAQDVQTSAATNSFVSEPPSMSSVEFGHCRIHFWLYRREVEKEGFLTAVVFQKSSTTSVGASIFAQAVSHAFAEHTCGKPLCRPVRGFNSVLRRQMENHLCKLVRIFVQTLVASMPDGELQQTPSDCHAASSDEPNIVSVSRLRSRSRALVHDSTSSL